MFSAPMVFCFLQSDFCHRSHTQTHFVLIWNPSEYMWILDTPDSGFSRPPEQVHTRNCKQWLGHIFKPFLDYFIALLALGNRYCESISLEIFRRQQQNIKAGLGFFIKWGPWTCSGPISMHLILDALLIQSDSLLFYFDICAAYDADGQNFQHSFLLPVYGNQDTWLYDLGRSWVVKVQSAALCLVIILNIPLI